jgi:hypothetical protein|tara:strand:+ start:2085 stop:3605 length:1521 start_codon:yes stop_codon:yes gene_type:complete
MDLDYKHPLYEAYIGRWNYYRASYLGGFDYRDASMGMLRKYLFEDEAPGNQYLNRLDYTALDNIVKLTVDTYRSFLFRSEPTRTFGYLADDIMIKRFLEDVDYSQQDLSDFMKQANDMATVYGNVWILCTKGQIQGVLTREQEIEADLRPYLKLFTPDAVCDWEYETRLNGSEELVYVKTKEWMAEDTFKYIMWTPEQITTVISKEDEIISSDTVINPIGTVPFVVHYANPTQYKGIGQSDIADVSKIMQAMFNLLSEAEQSIRISGHPTLVKTMDTPAMAGAGAVINMDNNLDPNLRPFLLEPSGSNVNGIVEMIKMHIESFLRQTNLGAIMAARGLSVKSGVALSHEFEQLNARLADKSAKMEATEWNIWKLFWKWTDMMPDAEFNIEYKKAFDLRDEHADLKLFNEALNIPVQSETYAKELHKQIAKIVIKDGDKLDDVLKEIDEETPITTDMPHPTVTEETKIPHIKAMIEEGLTDEEMLELHPELTQNDINIAKGENDAIS